MGIVVGNETIEKISMLSALELSEAEKVRLAEDMNQMLSLMEKMNEADTSGIEPMTHVAEIKNVFRQDVMDEGRGEAEELLCSFAHVSNNMFSVPNTFANESK